MRPLEGRVALVTGGSRGIGAATVRSLAEAGAQVVALSHSGADPGVPGAVAIGCDLRDRAATFEAVDGVVSRLGRLDIVVPNAGVGSYGPFLELSPEDVDEMIDVNVKGTLYTLQATLPHLLQSPAADVVIIASEAGRRGLPGESVYCASKFAQVGLGRALDHELREHGVRCTNLCPGGVATGFAFGHGRDPADEVGMMTAEEIADIVLFAVTRPRGMRLLEIALRPMTESSWG
jgi:NAD(P)-dependent dehydrogenase (short-subunit alcohol dehydrogenase family)